MERRALLKRVLFGIVPGIFPGWFRPRLTLLTLAESSSIGGTQLRGLATVVLPASLGQSRIDDIADDFAKWVRGYKEGADLGYGYGFTRPRKAPPSPGAQYAKQLSQLYAVAQAKGTAFAKLDRKVQRELVALALKDAKIEAVPRRPNGEHVAADLMSFFFYINPSGEDFLYGAAIKREDCRGLASSSERPASVSQ